MKLINIEILDDNKFLSRRQKVVSRINIAVISSLVLLAALVVYLFIKAPYMINTAEVVRRLQNDSLPLSTLKTAMVLMPMNMILLITIMVFLILFLYVSLVREKRYLRIIEDLKNKTL